MNDMHANRLAAVRRRMEEMGLSSLLVSEPAALWYLTGETIHPGERLTVLLVPAKGSALWIRNRLFPLAKGMDLSPEEAEKAGLPADISFEDGEDGLALLSRHLPEGTVGIDKFWPSHFLLSLMEKRKDLSFKNGSPAVDRTRAIKDGEETDTMRLASFINDRAMERIARFLHDGVTEKECARGSLPSTGKREQRASPSRPSFPSVPTAPTPITCLTTRCSMKGMWPSLI